MADFRTILRNNAFYELNEKAIRDFEIYAQMLVEYNNSINLTSITELNDIALKHFIDSFSMLKYIDIKPGSTIADVGTGAGFPGLPLLIVRNDINLSLIDSLNKRLNFIEDVLNNIDLSADLYHLRAEIGGKSPEHRDKYDFVVSRAVARLNTLVELCMPYVKVGGKFIALKGSSAEEEIKEAENAIKLLGGTLKSIKTFSLVDENDRSLVIIEKISSTDSLYPRNFKKISTKPL